MLYSWKGGGGNKSKFLGATLPNAGREKGIMQEIGMGGAYSFRSWKRGDSSREGSVLTRSISGIAL